MRARIALLLLLLPLACGKSRVLTLTERADEYNRNVKWGSTAAAGRFLAEANRKTLMERIAKSAAEFPIVDYSVLDLNVEPGDRKGSALVEFSYYGTSDQTLHYRQEMQVWQWDSSKINWFLIEARDVRPDKR